MSARQKMILEKFANRRSWVIVSGILLILIVIFFPAFKRSKQAEMLIKNKNALTNHYVEFQQISSALNNLLRLDANSELFNQEKSIAINTIRESSGQDSTLVQDLVVHRSALLNDPDIIDQLNDQEEELNEQRNVYLQKLTQLMDQLEQYDDQSAILYEYDVAIDFGAGLTTENAPVMSERATQAKNNIQRIKTFLQALNYRTEKIDTSIDELDALEDRFSELSGSINSGNLASAAQIINEIDAEYPEIEKKLYAGMLSLFTREENLDFFVVQGELLENYEFYINSITQEQNRL